MGNLHRADFAAGTAGWKPRAGWRWLPGPRGGRDDFADGAGVGRAVGVAADNGVNRAMVHAGAAADALQGLPECWSA